MCPTSPLVQKRSFECDVNVHLDRRSQSLAIPLPESHIRRTKSEVQLNENMAVAEYRDRCMFNRLVCGIRERQQLHYNFQRHVVDWNQSPDDHQHHRRLSQCSSDDGRNVSSSSTCSALPPPPIHDTERTIENIISTRYKPIESEDTISNTTSYDSTGVGGPTTTANNAHNTNANFANAEDDWAIEGFEAFSAALRQSHDEEDDSDYHVFPMDL